MKKNQTPLQGLKKFNPPPDQKEIPPPLPVLNGGFFTMVSLCKQIYCDIPLVYTK